MGAAGEPPSFAPSDVSTFLYVVLLLAGIAALRCAPFAALTGPPASLLFADTSASLFAAFAALILGAYLPASTGLAQRGGGQPLLLMVSVVSFVALSAPLAAIVRVSEASDASAVPRLVLADAALAGWLLALCKDVRAFVAAALLYGGIVLTHALAPHSVARLVLELVALVGLHYDLSARPLLPRTPKTSETTAWRLVALVVGVPLGIVALTPLVLVGSHVSGGLDARPVNHHGMPYCETTHATYYPSNVSAVQALVLEHAHVRCAGSGHSWSALAAPPKHGVVLSTALLRSLSLNNVTHELTAGAGTTFGSVQTFLHRHGRQLASNWHADVTLAGGVVNAVQHIGVGISELCVSVDIVLANGSLLTLGIGDPRFPMVFGSAGMLGVVVSVTLQTIERAELVWDSVTEAYADVPTLRARVEAWATDPSMRSSVLWVLPSLHETWTQKATLGPPLVPAIDPGASALPRVPHLAKRHYGDPGLSFSMYANLLTAALSFFEPIVRSVTTRIAEAEMRSFVRSYTESDVSLPHLPLSAAAEDDPDNNILPLRLSTVEVDVSVDASYLAPCIEAFVTEFAYPLALHVRWAQASELALAPSGVGVFHIDLSFSLPLLQLADDAIVEAIAACPEPLRNGYPVGHHPGKLTLAEVRERRLETPVKPATLPGRSASAAHAAFRALVDQLDPTAKFRPAQ